MKALLSMVVVSAFLWTAAGCGPKAQTTPAGGSTTPAAGGSTTPASTTPPAGSPPP